MTTQQHTETATPAEMLQLQHAAMRVSFNWWGTNRALRDDQQQEVADTFEADRQAVRARKTIINSKHPAYRAMTRIKRSITTYWKAQTLPFTEPGIRLLRHAKLETFDAFMKEAQSDLAAAGAELQSAYEQDPTLGRELGRLHDADDYPINVAELFAVSWHVENVSPPDWLLEVKPQWYERETQRIRGLFNDAVVLAEGEFISQLGKLVTNLTDRLTDNEDGTPKVFGDGCVKKLQEFIGRFRELSVQSNDDLEKLVDECDSLTRGVSAAQFRDLPELRQHVAGKLAEVKAAMEKDMTVAPRRRITRRPARKA